MSTTGAHKVAFTTLDELYIVHLNVIIFYVTQRILYIYIYIIVITLRHVHETL